MGYLLLNRLAFIGKQKHLWETIYENDALMDMSPLLYVRYIITRELKSQPYFCACLTF